MPLPCHGGAPNRLANGANCCTRALACDADDHSLAGGDARRKLRREARLILLRVLVHVWGVWRVRREARLVLLRRLWLLVLIESDEAEPRVLPGWSGLGLGLGLR